MRLIAADVARGVTSVVCLSVCLCVLVTHTDVLCTDEPIQMPFWGLTVVGLENRNHVLHGINNFGGCPAH